MSRPSHHLLAGLLPPECDEGLLAIVQELMTIDPGLYAEDVRTWMYALQIWTAREVVALKRPNLSGDF
jgi:hypothetical protein